MAPRIRSTSSLQHPFVHHRALWSCFGSQPPPHKTAVIAHLLPAQLSVASTLCCGKRCASSSMLSWHGRSTRPVVAGRLGQEVGQSYCASKQLLLAQVVATTSPTGEQVQGGSCAVTCVRRPNGATQENPLFPPHLPPPDGAPPSGCAAQRRGCCTGVGWSRNDRRAEQPPTGSLATHALAWSAKKQVLKPLACAALCACSLVAQRHAAQSKHTLSAPACSPNIVQHGGRVESSLQQLGQGRLRIQRVPAGGGRSISIIEG